MGYWSDDSHDIEYVWDDQHVNVDLTDNPITSVLYGPNGELLRLWRERPEIGFR